MGLILVALALIGLILVIIFTILAKNIYVIFCIGFLVVASFIFVGDIIGYKPPLSYHYQANILQRGNSAATAIYFSEFTQNDSEIVIDNYAIDAIHWTDFNRYKIVDEPLTIQLLDNKNQFIYKDRITGEKYGELNIATQ
jgi:hypothetical protein